MVHQASQGKARPSLGGGRQRNDHKGFAFSLKMLKIKECPVIAPGESNHWASTRFNGNEFLMKAVESGVLRRVLTPKYKPAKNRKVIL